MGAQSEMEPGVKGLLGAPSANLTAAVDRFVEALYKAIPDYDVRRSFLDSRDRINEQTVLNVASVRGSSG